MKKNKSSHQGRNTALFSTLVCGALSASCTGDGMGVLDVPTGGGGADSDG